MLRQFHLVILIHSSDLFIFIFLHTVLCVRIFVIIFFPLTYPCSLCYVKWSCVCLSNSVSSFFISFHLVTYIHTSSRCYIHLFVGVLLSYIYFFFYKCVNVLFVKWLRVCFYNSISSLLSIHLIILFANLVMWILFLVCVCLSFSPSVVFDLCEMIEYFSVEFCLISFIHPFGFLYTCLVIFVKRVRVFVII